MCLNSKIIIVFLIICLLSVSARASSPAFIISDTLIENIVNGNNDVGDLIFIEMPYIPDNYTFNNFSVLNLQQYDKATWTGNSTIVIVSPTGTQSNVVPDSSYIFPLDGTYAFKLLSNSSTSSSIIASRYDNINIVIEVKEMPNGFNVTFSDISFVLNGERVISEIVKVDDDVATGEYEINILINNVSYTQEFTVGSNKQWRLKENKVNNTITSKSGDNVFIGYFLLENIGNSDVEITTSKIGINNYIIGIPQPQTLYKKSDLRVNLQLQIPTTFSPGVYYYNITLSGGEINFVQQIKIIVIDSIKPILESINFSTDKVNKDNNIILIATDNDVVSSVQLKYSGKSFNFKKDGQKFTLTHKFDKLSLYNLEFCAVDNANNNNCIVVNKTFVKTILVDGAKTQIKMPSKKIGTYSTMILFNLSNEVDEVVTVELVEFNSNSINMSDSYSIRIIDGDGTVKRLTKYDNQIEISSPGEIKIEVRSEEVADYSGLLRLILPDYANEVSDIKFTVSFKEYDVPEDFSVDWIGDRKLDCTVVDTGNLDTSYYSCTLKYPIDTRPEEISVPTTVSERNTFKSEAGDVQKTLVSYKRKSAVFITLLMIGLILLGGIIYYVLYQHPFIRFTFGHKLKLKYNNKGEIIKRV